MPPRRTDLLYHFGVGLVFLATARSDGGPRLHPMWSGRILTVHDNASFRDLVRALGLPAKERAVPTQLAFASGDEPVRVGQTHDLIPLGLPMSSEEALVVLECDRKPAVGQKGWRTAG